MNADERSRRRQAGFRWATREHRWRWTAYRILIMGILILAMGLAVWMRWIVVAGTAVVSLGLACETVSYIAHHCERRAMYPLRHQEDRQ